MPLSHNGENSFYAYNADGQRIKKICSGTIYNYYYSDGALVRQTGGGNTIDFLYDENGSVYSIVITENSMKDAEYADRIAEIEKIITERASHQNEYDDSIVRQMVECIKVYADKHIEVIFGGGYAVEEMVE